MIQSSETLGRIGGRHCRLLVMDDVRDWPERSPAQSERFVLFLALQPPNPGDPVLYAEIERIIGHGCVMLGAFGPDAGFVDDLLVRKRSEPEAARPGVLSCWFEETDPEETLEGSLEIALRKVEPFEESRAGCREAIVALVGRPELAERVRAWCSANAS